MLHEILLALSGHPSPLFSDEVLEADSSDAIPLSPSEKALLRSIGQLSDLHRKLRQHVDAIARKHSSMICRAVATSIQQTHLPRFQDKIIDVEKKILTKDATLVGAYDIVPLAGIVGEFDGWHRRMAWYWDMTCFMRPKNGSQTGNECTGATLIDKLRAEQQTGFPDIKRAAIELSMAAETAWLRQIASWVLYGKIPKFGADDFFIRAKDDDDNDKFYKEKDLLPKFVTATTASSILFIGKSLHQIRRYGKQTLSSISKMSSETELAATHLQHLATLSLPIISAQFSRAISAVRLSLSQNILQHLLPMETVLELLFCLKDYFLLGRGEFAVALIHEADARLQARQQGMGKYLQQQDPVKALQSLSLKDADFQQTLLATWKALAALDDDAEDNILDFARRHFTLGSSAEVDSRPSTADSVHEASVNISTISFTDLLFPSATSLGLRITPPLDLFMSSREVEIYSAINTYLLAIRRAHLRLSELWRRSVARRDHHSPRSKGPSTGTTATRERMAKRRVATRKVWATCSAAIFLVSGTSAYFEGEIIHPSWNHFEEWVKTPVSNEQAEGTELRSSTYSTDSVAQRDPETLASGHRTFLSALTYALLLNDIPYTREVRSLLGNIDNFIAFFTRLLDVQSKLDLEYASASFQIDAGPSAYAIEEEQCTSLDLDRARKKVDSDLKSVINRLRQLDYERIGSARHLDSTAMDSRGFEPFKCGGVDRLLMRLDFGRGGEDVEREGFDVV